MGPGKIPATKAVLEIVGNGDQGRHSGVGGRAYHLGPVGIKLLIRQVSVAVNQMCHNFRAISINEKSSPKAALHYR